MSSKHLKILSLDLTYPHLSLEFFYEFLNRNAWIRVSRRFSFHRTPHPPLTPWTKMSWRTASGFFAQAHTTRSFSTARARSLRRCIPASSCASTFLLSLLAPYTATSTYMPSSSLCFALRWSPPTSVFPPMEGVCTYGRVCTPRLPTPPRPPQLQRVVLTPP